MSLTNALSVMSRYNSEFCSDWAPRMEIYRKDSEYVVRIDLPGVNPNDVQVHTERNLPTITRERKTEEQVHDYPETCYDNFERTLTLPQGVEADEIVARYQHGVLEIRMPLWPSLPDGRFRSRSSNRPIGSWNLRPRKLRSAIQTALLRRIEILSANVVRLKHLELIARGP